jgi:hypothetical protein
MAYKVLGIVVWKGAKWFLRHKYGSARAPKGMLAGGLLVLIVGIVLASRQRANGD